jgi:hypothetical protein
MRISSLEDALTTIFLLGILFCILIHSYLFSQLTHVQSNDHVLRRANRYQTSDDNIKVWIAGIQRDASQIESRPLKTLLELNCLHSVGVHILSREHASIAIKKMTDLKASFFHNSTQNCAPLIIQDQDSLGDLGKLSPEIEGNRIDRISALRDIQRGLLRQEYTAHRGTNRYFNDDGAVIIAGNILVLLF